MSEALDSNLTPTLNEMLREPSFPVLTTKKVSRYYKSPAGDKTTPGWEPCSGPCWWNNQWTPDLWYRDMGAEWTIVCDEELKCSLEPRIDHLDTQAQGKHLGLNLRANPGILPSVWYPLYPGYLQFLHDLQEVTCIHVNAYMEMLEMSISFQQMSNCLLRYYCRFE